MTLTHLLINPSENRLRAGWRLALHFLLLLTFTVLFGLMAGLIMAFQAGAESTGGMLITSAASLLAVTLSVRLARRFIDRRGMGDLGLVRGRALRDLMVGFGLAGAMMGLIFVLALALGWTRFDGFSWQAMDAAELYVGVLTWLAVFLMVGWYEELLARGYWLVNLRQGLGLPLAVLITSGIFALLHGANPNSSWISAAGLFAGGLWFAYAAIRSKGLWLPIGAHIGWNIFEGVVFGFPVSGLETASLILQTTTGPALWTGGAFGPEAGLLLLPALALGTLGVWGYGRAPNEIGG